VLSETTVTSVVITGQVVVVVVYDKVEVPLFGSAALKIEPFSGPRAVMNAEELAISEIEAEDSAAE